MFLLDVCRALSSAKVPYAIVGGFAVALHGATRGTVDIDLILEISELNFVAAERAFTELGLSSRLPVKAKDVFQFRAEWIANRNLIAWSFHDLQNPLKQLDVIIATDLAKKKIKRIKIHGTEVKLLALADLIAMKKKSGRPQDLEDVKALESLDG